MVPVCLILSGYLHVTVGYFYMNLIYGEIAPSLFQTDTPVDTQHSFHRDFAFRLRICSLTDKKQLQPTCSGELG